ncbi:MAG: winged helix-turn-helix domain-containing protein [Desulfobacterales bacterium]|nr:winged helix-turn-helix domain-containing protein [Desulfobacterales bacterium]
MLKKLLKVKFNISTVRERILPILKLMDTGDPPLNYPAKIARMLGMSRPHLHYYIKKMVRAGLITRKRIRWPAMYVVTPKGKRFLTSCNVLEPGYLFRLHKCGFKYPVLGGARVPVDWRRVPKACGHWVALIGREAGVKVEKTTRHVIVWCESISGRDPDELLLTAKSMADRVAASLVAKYGFRFGEGKLVKKPHIGVYDPVAELVSKRLEISDDVGKIDRSEGVGEIDWYTAKAAKDYLLMPGRVETVEKNLASLEVQVAELVKVLKEALSPREAPSRQFKDRTYIS